MNIEIDLHVHSKVSKTIPFKAQYFEAMVGRARRTGLQGFALTEHIHTPDYWATMARISQRYDYRDGQFTISKGFNVLTGTELTVAERADVILIGPLEALHSFDQHFMPRLSQGYLPPLAEIFAPARKAGLLMIGAHPTRAVKPLAYVGKAHLGKFDALEINGKDMANGRADIVVGGMASDLGLPTVGSSDAHLWPQVGIQRSIVPLSELTQDGLREVIATHKVATETSKNVATIVKLCDNHKDIIRQRLSAHRQVTITPQAHPVMSSAVPTLLGA